MEETWKELPKLSYSISFKCIIGILHISLKDILRYPFLFIIFNIISSKINRGNRVEKNGNWVEENNLAHHKVLKKRQNKWKKLEIGLFSNFLSYLYLRKKFSLSVCKLKKD